MSTTPDYLASLRLLAAYARGSRLVLLASALLATAGVALELVPFWIVYRLVAAVTAGTAHPGDLLAAALLVTGAVLAGCAAMAAAMALSHRAAFDVIHRIRLALARRMAVLPLGYFAGRRSGDAKKLVIDEPEQLEAIIAHGLPEGVSALTAWLAVSVLLFAMDWRMALATIALTVLSFAMLGVAMAGSGKHAARYQRAGARMNAAIVEHVAAMPAVKVFSPPGADIGEAAASVRAFARAEMRWAGDYLPLGAPFQSLALASIALILPVGGALLQAGEIDIATLLLFVILGANYGQPLLKLMHQFQGFAHISMGATEVMALLREPPQQDTGRTLSLPHYDVVFDKVRFGYGGPDVLHGVSFTAPAGSFTALVGPSGSGKSTILSLIPRFHDVGDGRITLGGVDLRDIGLAPLMEAVSFVFQDTILFSDTIAANIRLGRPTASDAEVEAAARAARAHDFIMTLPQGYATRYGDEGQLLSGGERQRIAIARAILKDAPVVVLDEATAFADPDNEAAIQEAIEALTRGRTLIVTAHRLHTVATADRILVVEHGRIVAQGTHRELLTANGLYASMWAEHERGRHRGLRPAAEVRAS